MRRKLLLYTAGIGLLSILLSSCNSNPYSFKNSAYYKSMETKYKVGDQHVDCPIIVQPPSKRRKR